MKLYKSIYKKILGNDHLHNWKNPSSTLVHKLGPDGTMKMFIYSEYLKRRFYADLYIQKNNDTNIISLSVIDSIYSIINKLLPADAHISISKIENNYLKNYKGKKRFI